MNIAKGSASVRINPIALLYLAALASACAPKGDDWQYAVTPGVYDQAPPLCLSSGKAPDYPAASFQSALFDFADLTAHTLKLDAASSIETLTTHECTLTIARSISQNKAGELALSRDHHYVFTPAGCSQSLVWDGRSYAVSPDYGDLFKDSDDKSREIPFVATVTANDAYSLLTRDDPVLNQIWGSYGCAPLDRLLVTLKRRADL